MTDKERLTRAEARIHTARMMLEDALSLVTGHEKNVYTDVSVALKLTCAAGLTVSGSQRLYADIEGQLSLDV